MALTGFLGFLGVLSHRKTIMVFYIMLVWPIIAGWVVVGYMSYNKRNSINYNADLNRDWDAYGADRQVVQLKVKEHGKITNINFFSLAAVVMQVTWTGHLLMPNVKDLKIQIQQYREIL